MNAKMMKRYSEKDYKVLWHNGFWDGPISGCLSLKNGEFLYFQSVVDANEPFSDDDKELFDENGNERDVNWFNYRVYAVYKPTDEQKKSLIKNNENFEKYVGKHNNWDYRWADIDGLLRPRSEWEKFYGKEYPIPFFEPGQIVGFTTMTELYDSRKYNNQLLKK